MSFDIVALILVALFALIGFLKGFLSQIISYITAIVALVVAYVLRHKAAAALLQFLEDRYPDVGANHKMLIVICMLVIFIVVYFILGGILETIKKRLVVSFSMKMSDRFFGFILGTLKGALLVLFCIMMIDYTKGPLRDKASTDEDFSSKFEKYEEWLDKSEVYKGGQSALGWSEQNYPWASNIIAKTNISFIEKDKENK